MAISSYPQTGCHTAPGRLRNHNEDACGLPARGADLARFGTLLIVADGVGGMPGGAQASQHAVRDLQTLFYAGSGPSQAADRLRYCVESINALNRLHPDKSDRIDGYLTTLVAAVIDGDEIWIANVGDSRAYLIQSLKSRRVQLTEDHSRETRMAKRGLTGDQAGLPHQGVITRAIGLEDHCQVDTYHYTWSPGDRLVLCSDGLAQLAEQEMINLTVGQPAPLAAKRLVDRAIEVDGSDNCTAVVAVWDVSDPVQPEASADSSGHSNRVTSTGRHLHPLVLLSIGLLLGWLSAVLITLFWLDAAGILNVF